MSKHALLSASSAKRWLNCPPSARLCEGYIDTPSTYAAEGTEAHMLCEYHLKRGLGIDANDPTDCLTYFCEEMDDCAGDYADFILDTVEDAKQLCPDPLVLIEQKLDFSRYAPDGFGTADCVIIADSKLHIVDYKHGKGVRVEAEDNPQMMLYALGALELFDGLYDIDVVSMTIFQPRLDNVSTHTVYKESLYQWAEEILKPAAEAAYAGEGEYKSGDWCRFCKAKHDCRARADANLALAQLDFKKPPLLDDAEIENVLSQIDKLVSWATDVKEYALQAALKGKKWSAWKLVEGRSNRKYIDEDAVVEIVMGAGFDPWEHKVRGITDLENLLGKARFNKLLKAHIEKPPGKLTLVPSSDKRPAVEINSAADDFADNEN